MLEIDRTESTALHGRWREFYEQLRADIIEAQCALESGRVVRASELIDSILRRARRTSAHFSERRAACRTRRTK